jgi:hypothetical protein
MYQPSKRVSGGNPDKPQKQNDDEYLNHHTSESRRGLSRRWMIPLTVTQKEVGSMCAPLFYLDGAHITARLNQLFARVRRYYSEGRALYRR